MIGTMHLDENDVARVIAAAAAAARAAGWKVSVAVVDAGGHLLGFLRMDGVSPATARVAGAKARTAAIFRTATGALEDRIPERGAILAMPGATPLKGGVPLLFEGQVVGGVGISGLAPHQDHQIAEAAAGAL